MRYGKCLFLGYATLLLLMSVQVFYYTQLLQEIYFKRNRNSPSMSVILFFFHSAFTAFAIQLQSMCRATVTCFFDPMEMTLEEMLAAVNSVGPFEQLEF
ncbi:MAG: hypothetical protein A3I77_08025 [Gammaproteobacteria bacterium RIFCSPLOWO2_02_FULL_42_14]|nr:MAG: hypothetical protein A3B71_03860 [Gammaproteobacteria bacterium RIFCSPHIGHO2_02_FULL_42_43]OGT29151.1 MAG: hypothetical protein A2624_01335 [Gammaproteobacteria bacterium RIFCSPHIGHO2_01_FULL_42_8]OGT52943.1 MAG: hypothetical protein A3E54_07665 [Gammaproteobacteria bacterium RIFCSPHIGHO2_12_FULL_41_25]OGT61283.1 MAG: hypothetical protein A3I77_08025 [Gammaproteobacteria bacterium RIFCSPLOWO2_02_FULL_42_14]OGT87212.1 MAG: hypothetical protein A3G86_01750 [Gammaproteobacteria bacterium R